MANLMNPHDAYNMKVFTLPDDIFGDKSKVIDPIIIHEYNAPTASFRGRSVMNKHAISLVIKGRKTMHFAEKTVNANDNELHFLSAGNCIVAIDFADQKEFRSVLIYFDNKVLNDFYVKHDAAIQRMKSRHNIGHEPYISIKKDAFIRNYIAGLQLMLKQPREMSLQMRVLKFEELMLYLFEKHPATVLSFRGAPSNVSNDLQIRRIVELNVPNSLTVDELAFLCNMSNSTFKRRFTAIYKLSPIAWFLGQKMKLAAKMLSLNEEKPSDVFYKVGYENHSSFAKSFKKFYGVTPKEFQARCLNV
ncbi:MAG: AraC family transcriptional regulator [Chryseolinea sp.]